MNKPLPIAAFYTIPELCRACSGKMYYGRMKRLLEKLGVEVIQVDGRKIISAVELRTKATQVWDAIMESEMNRFG